MDRNNLFYSQNNLSFCCHGNTSKPSVKRKKQNILFKEKKKNSYFFR